MGRKAILSRQKVMTAALQIVDDQGLEALSMRRLAAVLEVEAMSLYRHVASKSALLDAVHEAVLARMQLPRCRGDWLEDTRRLARAFRRVLCAHPNTLPLFATRPAVTAGSLEAVEHALTILAEPFPDLAARIQALQVLVTFTVGNTTSHFSEHAGVDYQGLSADAFPLLSRAAEVLRHYSVEQEFELGLDALLLGLQAKAGLQSSGQSTQ